MFTVCVGLVCGSEYVKFRISRSFLCSMVVDAFKIDPSSI